MPYRKTVFLIKHEESHLGLLLAALAHFNEGMDFTLLHIAKSGMACN
jgi:hypothetical protein